MKIIGTILAVILIFTAIYTWYNTQQILVPVLLLNSAAIILTEGNRELKGFFTKISWVLVFLLILKLIFGY
jgi:hypothetical protein